MDCSGKRDRVEFVPNKSFNEVNLRNDFHFLEDILQTKDTAKRTYNQYCGNNIWIY